jgi:hypothetical protein
LRLFAFRLALALGKDVEEVLAWPWPKLREWLAYWQIEPFGPLEDSRRAAVMAMSVLSPWSKASVKPEDLFPELGEKKKLQRPEDQIEAAKLWCALVGGTVIDGNGDR